MGVSMSLPEAEADERRQRAHDEGSPSEGALLVKDHMGHMVQVMEGDMVRLVGGGNAMRVLHVDDLLSRVLVRADAESAQEQYVEPEELLLLNQGVTLARNQMRQLLALYLARCSQEACAPHEGLVRGFEQSILRAHTHPYQVCLDLSGRQLRDNEMTRLYQSRRQHEDDACRGPAAICSAVKMVDVSNNNLSSEGASVLCQMIARDIPFCEQLYLDYNHISDAFQSMLPVNLAAGSEQTSAPECSLGHLQVLAACHNKIRTLRTLPVLPALHTLLLDSNPLGPGLSASAFANCTKLTTLSLCAAGLNNLSRISACLQSLPNLRELCLQGDLSLSSSRSEEEASPTSAVPTAVRTESSRLRVAAAATARAASADSTTAGADAGADADSTTAGADAHQQIARPQAQMERTRGVGSTAGADADAGLRLVGIGARGAREGLDGGWGEESNDEHAERRHSGARGQDGHAGPSRVSGGGWNGDVTVADVEGANRGGRGDFAAVVASGARQPGVGVMDRSPFVIHNMLEVDDARGLEGVGIQTMESAGLDELDVLDAQGLLDEAGDGDGRDAFFWGGLIANGLIPELVLPNTILAERFYREFLLWHVQSLEVLDGLHVSPAQRSVSERVFCMHFERLAYGRTRSSNAVHALRLRECGLKPADRAPSLARRQACWASAAPALPVVLDVEASRRAGEEHGCISADEQCTNMGDVGQSCSWSFGQVHSEPDRASGQGMQRLTTGLLAGIEEWSANGEGESRSPSDGQSRSRGEVGTCMEEGHDGGVGARENVPGDDARRLLDTQGSTDLRIPRSSQLEAALGCRVMSSAQYRSEPLSFVRSMCAARQDRLCVTPMTRVIAPSHFRPRQFEYHPRKAEELVLGSVSGDVIVLNHPTGSVVGSTAIRGPAHSILGLCWLHTDGSLLISGADNGNIQLLDVDLMKKGEGEAALYEYDPFEHLTSVHINSLDDSFLVSGYSNDVGLYDLKIGKKIQTFKDLHTQHINVLKFANHSPSLFATSSFDGDVKMWDLRQGMQRPVFTRTSDQGNVMVCFSHDDRYLLSSAVDNEVRQYLAVDGRQAVKLEIAPIGSEHNYTRSYYMNGSDYIISGSCEESVVRVFCAKTGRFFRDVSLDGAVSGPSSLYIQSLRGDPFKHFHLSVLVAYNHPMAPSEMLEINLLAQMDPSCPSTYFSA